MRYGNTHSSYIDECVLFIRVSDFFYFAAAFCFISAWAAASLAMGTRYGEQLT